MEKWRWKVWYKRIPGAIVRTLGLGLALVFILIIIVPACLAKVAIWLLKHFLNISAEIVLLCRSLVDRGQDMMAERIKED